MHLESGDTLCEVAAIVSATFSIVLSHILRIAITITKTITITITTSIATRKGIVGFDLGMATVAQKS